MVNYLGKFIPNLSQITAPLRQLLKKDVWLCPKKEKKTLSIVFGVERFHEYLYGRHFTVINDHQPLKSIFNKSITQCPPRIQRLFHETPKI